MDIRGSQKMTHTNIGDSLIFHPYQYQDICGDFYVFYEN